MNTDYGKSFISYFKLYYENLGGKVGLVDKFNMTDVDFRTQLTKFAAENSKYIVLASVPKQAGMIMKQARKMGTNNQFFATSAVEGQDVLDVGGEASEGLIFSSAYDNWSEDSDMKLYRNKYF